MRWFFVAPLLATAVGCATIPDRPAPPPSTTDPSFAYGSSGPTAPSIDGAHSEERID
jgi:hypothetical protein